MEHNRAYTASDAMNDALVTAGVDCVFLNSGTDYTPIIESWAKYESQGRKIPRIIISPHEIPAMCAAQGYAQITGRAQAVFVHVDVGTQNLGGAVHNAFRCRVPVFIFAGLSPYTAEGELHGGRNKYIQYIQNSEDQAGIVRGYTKLNFEYRGGQNVQQMTYRALQLAQSEPMGPVYMMATREVLEEDGIDIGADLSMWSPITPPALDDKSVNTIVGALTAAKKPLIVTAYAGRNTECVPELIKLAEKLAIPVVEVNEQACMNFPGSHPMHLGFESQDFAGDADVVLSIDCDLPWLPSFKVNPRCRVFSIDIDPLKEHIPLWYLKAERFMLADSLIAIRQINKALQSSSSIDRALVESRRMTVTAIHKKQRENWEQSGAAPDGHITAEFLTVCLREVIDDDTVILNETITTRDATDKLLPRNKPGTLFGNGGSSLGWHGGAAIGMKLACPEKDIVALTGDGTYIFSCPTAVHWMAAKYDTPFMTVIYNNQGWNAPKQITTKMYPDGYAAKSNNFWVSLDPPSRFDLVAQAAGGAFAKTVSDPKELRAALLECRQAVKGGRSAVINVILPPV